MNNIILKTRFNFPITDQDFIPKDELMAKLNEGGHKKLSIISALPGSGKTTYLGHRAKLNKFNTVWLSLNETDNSLGTFLILFISAFQQINKKLGDDLIPIIQASGNFNFEYVLTLLINELSELHTDFNVILDDFHLIQIPEIKNALNFFVENSPLNVHIFINSRNEVLLDCLPKLRMKNELVEIFQDSLNFNSRQIIDFFHKHNFILSDKQAASVEKKSQGWILAIRIALLTLNNDVNANALIDVSDEKIELLLQKLSGQTIISDYFNEFMLNNDDEKKGFLLKTCLLSGFDKEMADFFIGHDSRNFINWLLNNNLLLVSSDYEKEWFCYHHIFADFLKKYFLETNSALFIETHRSASKWYQAKEMFNEALFHAYHSTDNDFFSNTVSSLAFPIISTEKGRRDVLKYFIEKLPQEKIHSDFYLSLYYAWIIAEDFQVDYALKLLKNAEKLLKNNNIEKRSFDQSLIYTVYTIIYAKNSSHYLVEKYARKIIKNELNCYLLGRAYYALAYSHILQGDAKKAITEFITSASFHKMTGNIMAYLRSFSFIGRCFLYNGDLISARKNFEESIEEYRKNRLEKQFDLFGIYSDLSRINCFFNNREDANKYLDLASEFKNSFSSALIYYYLAYINIKIAFRELDSAETALREAKELVIKKNMDSYFDLIFSVESLLYLFQDKTYLVKEWAVETAAKLADKMNGLMEINMNNVIELHISLYPLLLYYLETSNYQEGMKLLNSFYKIVKNLRSDPIMIGTLILQAIFLARTDNFSRAKETLKQALILGESQNYTGLFVNEFPNAEIKQILIDLCAESRNSKKTFAWRVLQALDKYNPLTKREDEILRALQANTSNKELSEKLGVSMNTLKTHLKKIYRKLNVKNKKEALSKAANEK